jgi:hypothetical protein
MQPSTMLRGVGGDASMAPPASAVASVVKRFFILCSTSANANCALSFSQLLNKMLALSDAGICSSLANTVG